MSKGDGEGGSAYPKSVQAGIPKLSNPSGWPVVRIGDIFKVVQRPVDLQDDAEYQLVTAKRNRGGVVPRERLTGKAILTKSQFRIATGDFLISRRQIAHGACGIVPEELAGAIVSNEYATLLPTDLLDPGFMRHLPESIYFQQTCFHSSIGVHVEKLVFNLEDWRRWSIAVPEVNQQQRIATVLDHWDDALNQAHDLIRNRQRIRAAISRRTFPLFRDLRSLRPMSHFKIGSHAKVIRGIAYDPKNDIDPHGVGVLTAAHTQGGELFLEPEWTTVRAQIVRIEQCIQVGDFLIAMSNGSKNLVGKAGLVRNLPEKILGAGAFCATARPKNESSRRILDHAFRSERYRELLHVALAGSSIGNLTETDLREFDFYWSGNQRDLEALDLIGQEILEEIDRLTLLRRQKRGLMQKLLTGELPVPESIDRLMPGGDAAATLAREASAA